MLSSLLFLAQAAAPAAEAAAAHGEAASGVSKILGDFGISWPFILAQILNFSVVAFILWKFAFKPVLATLDERQQKIAVFRRRCQKGAGGFGASRREFARGRRFPSLSADHDPGEPPNESAVLTAPYGRGMFVYTTLSLFRQVPGAVPGGARLIVNLLSATQAVGQVTP